MSIGRASGRSSGIGFFDRLKTGLTLTKDSFGVLKNHPKLLVFPLLAGLSSLAFFVLFFFPLLVANLLGSGAEYVVLFALYFTTTFVSTYFSAALVHAVNRSFHGEEPGIVDSVKAVRNRVGPILVWSAISATVSLVLRSLEESDNPVASIVRALFAFGWSIMTFFIVPVIVFEEVSVTSMFSKSASRFKDTWGENLGAGFGISLIVGAIGIVLVVLALAVSVPVAAIFPGPGILLAIVLVGGAITFTYLLSQTIWGIAKTALYIYAVEGKTPAEFENFDFETLGGRAERSASTGTSETRDAWADD